MIQRSQYWTVVSWLTYPVVYIFPMIGFSGSHSGGLLHLRHYFQVRRWPCDLWCHGSEIRGCQGGCFVATVSLQLVRSHTSLGHFFNAQRFLLPSFKFSSFLFACKRPFTTFSRTFCRRAHYFPQLSSMKKKK